MKRKILRKTRIVTILSALVVFLTVYSLVLPAITLTDDAATEDPGINTSETTNVAEVEKLSLKDKTSSDVEVDTTEQAEEDVQKEEVKEEKKVVENVSYPAVSFSDSLGDMIVYVEAPEGTFPENTQMQLKEVEDEAALVDSINSNLENKEVKAIKAVDITFIYNNEEFEPLKPIKVSMTSSFIESNKEDEQLLVHVDNDNNANIVETTEVKEKDVEVINNVEEVQALVENTDEINEITTDNTVAFESDAFSVYAVVYTVDFEYEGYTYSIDGGTSISLSKLFDALNIDKDINEVEDVSFSNDRYVKVVHPSKDITIREATEELGVEQVFSVWLDEQDEEDILSSIIHSGEWVLISVLPFDTNETLVIKFKNSDILSIRVSDDKTSQENGSDNLSSFLGNVIISNVEENDENDGTVRVGRTYSMHFRFAEYGDNQFSTTEPLTYKVPEGIKMIQPSGTFNVTYAGTSYSGNTFSYDEATNTLTVNFSDTVKALVAKSPDAQFTIDINGQFTGTASHFDFSSAIEKDYTVDNSHDVTVDKTGTYNSGDNKVHYTVTASSSGESKNVEIKDTITGTALTFDKGSIQVNGNSSDYSIEKTDTGFVVKLNSMEDQETVTVTYTASVNLNNITGKGTVTQTGNTVEIKADDDPGETKPTDVSNQIDYNPLYKSAGSVTGTGNTKTIPWTITVNGQQLKSVAGSTITDHNNSADVMSYSGEGITIKVMDGSNTIRTITKTWAELGVEDPLSATGWSYKLPDSEDDLNNTYKYVISYETTVDASGKITDFNVNNGISDDEGHTGGGGTNVGPGDDRVTLVKESTSYSAATSEWSISFNVPVSGLSSAVVTDTFPEKWASSHWVDQLTGEIVIEGLLDQESYSIDTSDGSKAVITFYKTGEKTAENQGLNGSESERTIIVKLSTENTPEWVQEFSGDGHTNTASLNVNGQVITDTATSYPKSEGVAKTGSYEGTVAIGGREYPVFKYTLNLYGVSDDSFDENGKLTLTDQYNGEYLKLYEKEDDWNDLRWSWAYMQQMYEEPTTYVDDNGQLTFTSDKKEFKLDSNGMYSPVYQIYYYLIVKDKNVLNTLESISIDSDDHKVELTNTATWGSFHDSVTIDYEYPAVDKEQLTHSDSKGIVKYKIVLNPDKQTLNNGESMELQDTATNITIDYSTIQIESEPQSDITYYYRGYTGYYTIPDNTKVTITYSARVIGDGNVPISNEAVMKGFRDSTSSTEQGDNSGSGSLNIDWVVVYKHEYRKMDKGLNGAVYVLTDENGNPILYPASAKEELVGKPVTFATSRKDLNELPDGTRVSEETNIRDGYAWLFLDKDETGLAFQKGITYYFKEFSAPPGYQRDDTLFQFTISDHPDYDDWEYHKGDILRLADSEVEGNLEIKKNLVGAANLTDTQKKQITFKITAVDTDGNPMNFPYSVDSEGKYKYTENAELNISYYDFENGVYKLQALPNGRYTVQETNAKLGGYIYNSTEYTVDGESGTREDLSGYVVIDDKTTHIFEYTNTYSEEDAHIRVVKKDGTGQINLYGATFQLFKKNNEGDFTPVTDHPGLTNDGKFTIDYDNRENGVTITQLEAGDYYIKETKAPTDYNLDETPFYFTVHENNAKITEGTHGTNVVFSNSPNEKNLVATVKDNISHTYTLTKVDALKLSKKLNGAEFVITQLLSIDNDGAVHGDSENYWIKKSNKDGEIFIDAEEMVLNPDRVYMIYESKAPEGYQLSSDIYYFYVGNGDPTLLQRLAGMDPRPSIVSLANGPQKTSVPNTEESIDLYVYKQWYKVDGNKDKDLVPWINEIEVQLYQVITDSNGHLISEAPYPDADTTYVLKQGAGGNNSYLDYKWEDLPTGDSVNTENPLIYSYYVKEVVPEGYEARYVLGTGGGNSIADTEHVKSNASDVKVDAQSEVKTIQLRNSPKVINLQMEKVWLDDGSHWNNNSVTFHIRYTDNTHTLENPGTPNNADLGGNYKVDPNMPGDSNVVGNQWAYDWPTLAPWTDNDPSNPRTYFVLEDSGHIANMKSAGYTDPDYSRVETSDGEKVVITNKKTSSDKLQVKKVWLNADGTQLASSVVPDVSIPIQLYKEEGITGEGYSVNVSVRNEWGISGPKTFVVKENGSIEFTLSVGNLSSYNPDESELGGGTFDVTSGKYTLSNVNQDTNVLIWFDNSWGNAPEKATYEEPETTWSGNKIPVTADDNITIDGSITDGRIELNSQNEWTYIFNNIVAPTGKLYRYSVRELKVPDGFIDSYVNNDGVVTGIIYVENIVSEYTRASATKKWVGADGNVGSAPADAEVVFTLYQDGRKTNQTVTLDGIIDENGETDAWLATFEGLEKNKADGSPHEYTVKELTGFIGYAAAVYNSEDEIWTVTENSNTTENGGIIYNKPVRQINVTKKWLDQSGIELENAPEGGSVTIGLYKKTDQTNAVQSIILDGRIDTHGEQQPWVATFSNLEDNTVYIVKESDCTLGEFELETIDPEESSPSNNDSFVVKNKKTKSSSIQIEILKVDATDMLTPLANAQFGLNKLDPNGKGTYLDGQSQKDSTITRTDGKAVVSEIEDGYYEISEIRVPAGFVIVDEGKLYISISDGKVSVLSKDTEKVVSEWTKRTLLPEDKIIFDNDKKFTIGNTPGVELPHTGGPGNEMIKLLGTAIMLASIAVFLKKKRK